MKKIVYIVMATLVLATTLPTFAAPGAIDKKYLGMWGAGGCSKAKYFVHIESSGIQMYASDKRTPLGNWDVRKVQANGKGIIIDTKETNSQKPTHMELTNLPNGHITLLLKIGGNGGADELARC